MFDFQNEANSEHLSENETSMQRRIQLNQFTIVLPLVAALAIGSPAAGAAEEANKPSLPTTLRYTSPLATYRNFAEQPVGSWRKTNDNVGRAGGWHAYAREMQESMPAEAPAKEADPHAGHHPETK